MLEAGAEETGLQERRAGAGGGGRRAKTGLVGSWVCDVAAADCKHSCTVV